MKKSFLAFLALIFVLPAFGAWMPHSALKALHIQKERHHQSSADHSHHDQNEQAKSSHSIHFDVITYFSDYLHVDLKNADHAAINTPVFDTHAFDGIMVAILSPPPFSPFMNRQSRGPPKYDWRTSYVTTPVYLATQRLRI